MIFTSGGEFFHFATFYQHVYVVICLLFPEHQLSWRQSSIGPMCVRQPAPGGEQDLDHGPEWQKVFRQMKYF